MNDEHTYDKKMAGSGHKIVIYQYVSFPIKLYLLPNPDSSSKEPSVKYNLEDW